MAEDRTYRRFGAGNRRPKVPPAVVWSLVLLGSFLLGAFLVAPMIQAGSPPEREGAKTVAEVSHHAPAPIKPVGPARQEPEVEVLSSGGPVKTAVNPAVSPGGSPTNTEEEPPRAAPASSHRRSAAMRVTGRPVGDTGSGRKVVQRPAASAAVTRRHREQPTEEPDRDWLRRQERDRESTRAFSQDLTGEWHGRHTGNRATLAITRQRGNSFSGTLTVETGEGPASVRVRGRVDRDGGISFEETGVTGGTPRNVWDLGRNTGRLIGRGRMEGSGRDSRGRSYSWSLER
jgi:hypothetical protein